MTRVLITTDAVGGVWHYATDLARALGAIGVEPVIAVLGPVPNAPQWPAEAGLRIIDTGLPLDWLAADAADVRRAGLAISALAGDLAADVVQLNMPALAVAAFDVPVVAVAHSCVGTWWDAVRAGALLGDLVWRDRLTTEGLARADVVVAPSQSFADAITAHHALSRLPRVVHNGRPAPAASSVVLGDYAFTVGRLWDEAKGIAVLDHAAAQLRVPLRAAGLLRGPNGASIELANIEALGLLDDRAIAGHLAHRPVFVSAARYEPFGLAVLEAAAAGCALVLSDIPTFRELWGGVASFVACDDAAGFVNAIEAQFADPAARRTAGARAAERARRFTTAAMARAMNAIYQSLLPPARVAA